LFLRQRELRPYWFETGTPRFLIDLLLRRRLAISDLDLFNADYDLLGSFDVDQIEPEALLFQTGYATIREQIRRPTGLTTYRLGFPNREVRASLPLAILRRYLPDSRERQRTEDRIFTALERDDPDALYQALHAFFATIPHDWYRKNRLAEYEAYYASIVYCYFAALGVDARPEEPSSRGQADLVIRYRELTWLLEFRCP